MAFVGCAEKTGGVQRIVVIAVLLSLCIPAAVMGSTPPLPPSLRFDIAVPDHGDVSSRELVVVWNRDHSFFSSPESIVVDAFVASNDEKIGSIVVAPIEGSCPSAETCEYRRTIETTDLPSGDVVLVASDPVSGATARQILSGTDRDNSTLFSRPGPALREYTFYAASGLAAVLLVVVLLVLLKKE